MTLLYSDVEEELRSAVRSLLADRCPPSAVLKRVESDQPYDLDLWKTLSREIGVAGLLVPEEYGGAGASAREAAVVLEELGRAVAPVPFFTSSVLATRALVSLRDPAARVGEVLRGLAAGDTIACLAVPFSTAPLNPSPARTTEVLGMRDGGPVVTASVAAVAGADIADLFLIPLDGALYLAESASAHVEAVPSLDMTRPIAAVVFDAAPVTPLGAVDLAEVLRFGAALLASEQLGVAEWCLEETLAYVKQRYQFARPIGSFQAIKHRLADLWLDVVRARAAARNAVAEDSPVAASTAQAWNAGVAVHAAEEAVQLHGGIGMTWEHPIHLYLKRAKADEIALGTPGDHRAALASLVGLPGPQ
ncbi:acyl-CoA dehydrogenase family protein [Thermoactinospora rubra]|uniref:acyl-CoA dehydrogenase family protein n=1 Tax=Thermoactinospora rubra TaxID=1088767 RepID=UPI000A0FACC0|nr:acyl-CoA dehydrogenase family protein [Thermoactinospora rubra]